VKQHLHRGSGAHLTSRSHHLAGEKARQAVSPPEYPERAQALELPDRALKTLTIAGNCVRNSGAKPPVQLLDDF